MLLYTCMISVLIMAGSSIGDDTARVAQMTGIAAVTHDFMKALDKEDAEAVAQTYTEDALLLFEGGIVTGREEIKNYYMDIFDSFDAFEWEPVSRTQSGSDFESEVGNLYRRDKNTGKWHDFLFLATAVKGKDGLWRYRYDSNIISVGGNKTRDTHMRGIAAVAHTMKEAYDKGDAEKVAQCYTENAMILTEGGIVSGREKIIAYYQDRFKLCDEIEWESVSRTQQSESDFESEVGNLYIRDKESGKWQDFLYLATAVKGEDGLWRYKYDSSFKPSAPIDGGTKTEN